LQADSKTLRGFSSGHKKGTRSEQQAGKRTAGRNHKSKSPPRVLLLPSGKVKDCVAVELGGRRFPRELGGERVLLISGEAQVYQGQGNPGCQYGGKKGTRGKNEKLCHFRSELTRPEKS